MKERVPVERKFMFAHTFNLTSTYNWLMKILGSNNTYVIILQGQISHSA